MRVGVFTPLLSQLPLSAVLDRLKSIGIDTVELGTGNYPGDAHCKLSMLEDSSALAEFQKILENRGPSDFLHWSLAHLGLARAYTLTGDKDKSLAAYREFFGLWKNADPDVPILKQAQSEYAKLQ